MNRRRRRHLKRHPLQVRHNRTGAEDLSFYYPRLLHCVNQMLAVMLLSQYRVSSSKTVRLRVLHVVPDVRDTLLERSLRFVQRRHTRNLVKEPDPICAWTNGIAQHQSAGG